MLPLVFIQMLRLQKSLSSPQSRFNFEFSVEIEITNTSSNDLKAGMYGTALFASKQQNNL
jgi:hypothetical protein